MLRISLQGTLIAALIKKKELGMFLNYNVLKKEPTYGKHRFDLLLTSTVDDARTVVELKSTTKVEQTIACFPDAVSSRATNHVNLLVEVAKNQSATLVFCIYRDCSFFKPCDKIDPAFAKAFYQAKNSNLEIIPLVFESRLRQSGSHFILETRFVKRVPIL